MTFNFYGYNKIKNMKNIVQFFIWVLATTIVVVSPLTSYTASVVEEQDFTPSPLFLVRFPDGKEISLLGTMHTYDYDSLPKAVKSHLEDLLCEEDCALIAETGSSGDFNTHKKALEENAVKGGLDPSAIKEWEELYKSMLDTYPQARQSRSIFQKKGPFHPLLILQAYTIYGLLIKDVFNYEQGLDHHILGLFSGKVYELDRDADHPDTYISPEQYNSYELFEKTVKEITEQYWGPEKDQVSSQESTTTDGEKYLENANINSINSSSITRSLIQRA